MSYSDAIRFGLDLPQKPRLQSELQEALNECVTQLVEIARANGTDISVRDAGEYISQHLFPDPDPAPDDRLNLVFSGMLKRVKVQDPNNRMFKTMSVGTMDGEVSPEIQAAIEATKARRKRD